MPAKRDTGMMGSKMCGCSHHKTFGWVILIVGILFLFENFGWWTFWGVQWWSVLFILIGLGAMCKCCDKGMCF